MAAARDPIQTLTDLLVEYGPLSEDDIVRRLAAAGLAAPEHALDALFDEVGVGAAQLVDERWVWLPKLLAGRVFTHRLSAEESAHDMLTVTPDLDPVTTLCESERYARFADGSRAHVAMPMFDLEVLDERDIPLDAVDPLGVLLLAPGTLASIGAAAGDLVALRLTAQGLAIERFTAVADAAVAPRFSALLNADRPEFFNAVVWTACADDSTLFTRPLTPLSEIVDTAGLARGGDQLAPPGFDFDVWRFNFTGERLAQRYGLDPAEALAMNTLLRVCDGMARRIEISDPDESFEVWPDVADEESDVEGGPSLRELTAEFGAVLADPVLAEIMMTEALGDGRSGAAALGMLAETLEPQVPRPARVACRWLRAVALERTGAVEQAEQELLAAEAMDTAWGPVLFDLARFASDRGDAERALSLLRQAGVAPDDPLVTLLEKHRVMPRPDLGRNDECWCGSGRKYKKCHLGREQLPLAERAGWLYAKAAQHVMMSGWGELLDEVADERGRHLGDDAADDAMNDPLVLDAVMFEGGAFADFIQVRGFLLPADERALAGQWLLVDRSVFEIDEVRRGQGITLRDVRTGDRHAVRERLASGQLKPGQLICARVVPVGDVMQIFGGLEPVALHERDAMIALLDSETDPITLVAQLSRRFAPPTLVNTDGDPLTICRATVQIGNSAGLEAALDEAYERVEDAEPARWLEYAAGNGMRRTIRATLAFDDATLHVETNSEQRMDAVLATLSRIDPAMTVLDDTRQPIRDTREAAEMAAQLPGGGGGVLDQDDAEVAAILEGVIREYETNWLDEPIPALDGHTPRQAADDPTRRADLVKLLASFPSGRAARGGMDADRLRAALGLS